MEEHCNQVMMMKYGQLVNLEVMQTLSGSRILEELKQEKLLKEAAYAKEIKEWDVSSVLCVCVGFYVCLSALKQVCDVYLNISVCIQGRQFQDYRRRVLQEDIQWLRDLVKTQCQQAEAFSREIFLLSHQGGHVLPPGQHPLPSIDPFPIPTDRTTTGAV
uniref:Uncharacterized protein n=1 Tax=Labrus bergylta TaxID=56723 RepID=A0A3Q3F8C3_9LABR